MEIFEGNNDSIVSRIKLLLLMVAPTLGYTCTIMHPTAAKDGACGHVIGYSLVTILLGIPLLYMEMVVSQFSSRDCLDMWRARPVLAHVGYINVVWQLICLIYNHVAATFLLHYLLISFEKKVPYFQCGPWSTDNCNLMQRNYTLRQDCLQTDEPEQYCFSMHTTFSEYQYWRYYILGGKSKYEIFVARRVCLSSFMLCVIIYFTCFKRGRSISQLLSVYVIFPYVGFLVFLLGSMLQKGVVQKYSEVLDSSFTEFSKRTVTTSLIHQGLYALNMGTGVMMNLSSGASFHMPAHSHAVICGVASATFSALVIFTTVMTTCPFTFEYGLQVATDMTQQLHLLFEKMPMMIHEYSNPSFYLLLMFSCQTVVGVNTVVILFYSLTEMIYKRYNKFAAYPALFSLFGVLFLFGSSVPLLGPFGINVIIEAKMGYMVMFPTFMLILEIIVFTVWYGFDKLAADIHFMQGIQPWTFLKIFWIFSLIILCYTFINELYLKYSQVGMSSDPVGLVLLCSFVVIIIIGCMVRLTIAACRGRLGEALQLDDKFGPNSELLRRSRAMFTAQAMTKEYMYRQYHLQAGVVARQRRSNVRAYAV